MTTYLIMRCEDEWEEAERTPKTLTHNWKQWYTITKPDFDFEVYQFDGTEFTCIKGQNEPMEKGMALVKVNCDDEEEVPPVVIKKYPDYTRHGAIPYDDIYEVGDHFCLYCNDVAAEVEKYGYVVIEDEDMGEHYYYCYGEYEDQHYNTGE